MKGNNAIIGAEVLSERARIVEALAKAGNLSGVLLENEKFIEDTETLVSNIQEWLSKNQ
jgi:hypothetical protein